MSDLKIGIKLTADGKQLISETGAAVKSIKKMGAETARVGKHSRAANKNIQKTSDAFGRSGKQAVRAASQVKRYQRNIDKTSQSTKKLSGNMNLLRGILGGLGAAYMTREIWKVATDFERIDRVMLLIAGSSEAAASEMKFVRDEAKRLGLHVRSAADDYAKFTLAAQGAGLSLAVSRNIWVSTMEAARAMGMSVDDTRGTMRAFIQMLSKGNVQAEELRGQLGERLVGAFQMAAGAMGVTTKELNKMLENGEVLANDLLPKMAIAMHEKFGVAAVNAASGAQAEMARFKNSLDETQKLVAQSGFMDVLISGMNGFRDVLVDKEFQNGLKTIVSGVTGLIKILGENPEILAILGGAWVGAKRGPYGALAGGLAGGLGAVIMSGEDSPEAQLKSLIARQSEFSNQLKIAELALVRQVENGGLANAIAMKRREVRNIKNAISKIDNEIKTIKIPPQNQRPKSGYDMTAMDDALSKSQSQKAAISPKVNARVAMINAEIAAMDDIINAYGKSAGAVELSKRKYSELLAIRSAVSDSLNGGERAAITASTQRILSRKLVLKQMAEVEKQHIASVLAVGDAVNSLKSPYQQQVLDLEKWRDQTILGLDRTKHGYKKFVAEISEVFSVKMKDIYQANIEDVGSWGAKFKQEIDGVFGKADEFSKDLGGMLVGGLKAGENAFVNFAKTGKFSFKSLSDSIISDLARIAYKQMILKPIIGLLGRFNFGSMFGGGGGNSVPTPNPAGSVGSGFIYHNGGVAGGNGSFTKQYSANVWDNAPRYHGGGIAGLRPKEVPAILERGERILTEGHSQSVERLISALANKAGGNSGNVRVNIIDQRRGGDGNGDAAGGVDQSRQQNNNGDEIINITIIDAVKSAFGTGEFDNSLNQNFGMNRVGFSR